MKQVFELKNISEETQLVLNENLEKVEVEAGETFKTKEKSYLRNYPHLFARVDEVETEEENTQDPIAPEQGDGEQKTDPETPEDPTDPQDPEQPEDPAETPTDPENPETPKTPETPEDPEQGETPEETEKKSKKSK